METYKTEYKPQDKGYRVKRTVCRIDMYPEFWTHKKLN